LQTLF